MYKPKPSPPLNPSPKPLLLSWPLSIKTFTASLKLRLSIPACALLIKPNKKQRKVESILNMDVNKQNISRRKNQTNPSTSTQKVFGASKLEIGENDASGLIGSIIEKGISETPQNKPTPPPQLTVLPFPVARHRSHGPVSPFTQSFAF